MKNDSPIRLMTLLKLLGDQFEPDERCRIEATVRKDVQAFARLRQLRDALGQSHTYPLDVFEVDSAEVEDKLQRIAAFFDGTLNVEETIAFESECWRSQQLLQEVVALFQSGLRSPSDRSVPSKLPARVEQQQLLRNRLLDMFPAEPEAAPRINGTNAAIDVAIRQATRLVDAQDELEVGPPVVVLPRNISRWQDATSRYSRLTKIAIALAVTVALVASSVIIANWNGMHAPPTVAVESPIESGIQPKPDTTSRIVGPDAIDAGNADPNSSRLDQIVDDEKPEFLPRNGDRELPGLRNTEAPDVRSPENLAEVMDLKTDPSPESVDPRLVNPAPRQTKLPWTWERVEGLVAVRAADSNVWSGALADDNPSGEKAMASVAEPVGGGGIVGLECRVLPLSWAQARLEGFGSLTITESADFAVTSTSVPVVDRQSAYRSPAPVDIIGVQINLVSGRIAIADTAVESVFLIETPTGSWRLRITVPGSIVIVEQGTNSRLVVQKGSVTVNDTELKAKQQVVRLRDGRLEKMANRETYKWLKKPEYKFPRRQLSDRWLVSHDLFAELKVPNVVSSEDLPLVRAAFATIDPPGQAALYLANVLPEVRAEGIQWLLAYGRDPQQLRRLAGELATELNTPGLRMTLPRLVMAIQQKRWPPQADAELLVTGLQSTNVSVRRLSHGFLIHLFGILEVYDSEADAATRQLQARKWLVAINRLYRRVDNARRR